jgi:hypothetical protein
MRPVTLSSVDQISHAMGEAGVAATTIRNEPQPSLSSVVLTDRVSLTDLS